MNRYSQLADLIEQTKPATICEIGTWNGLRACMMAEIALQHRETFHYTGFDLFEDATPESDAEELNVKAHNTLADVAETLRAFAGTHPGFTFELIKGNTRRTLKRALKKREPFDFAFLDGGHSVATIRSDFARLREAGAKVIVLDDYYKADEQGRKPDGRRYGCNRILKAFGEKGADWHLLPIKDRVKDGGWVQMAVVGIDDPQVTVSRPLKVKTKNAVPHEDILANIAHSLAQPVQEVQQCAIHDRIISMVSAGPSLLSCLDQIRADREAGHYIACVKHSHNVLIENGIIPDACVLLDPRGHVRDFVEEPHPDVTYFVASQVHPSTWEPLAKGNARAFLYHARVGAGEEMLLEGRHMILGGSTSATRGISLFYTMGARRFRMYAYDSCWHEMPAVIDEKESRKPMMVSVLGREFLTSAEMIAQCQDFETLLTAGIDIEVFGDGIIPHIWQQKWEPRGSFCDYARAA